MKRLFFSLVWIAIGLSLVVISAIKTGHAQSALADETLISEASSSAMATASAQIMKKPVQTPQGTYYFPYPGLLPDHLFYPVKMLRDKVLLMTTRDNSKKIGTLILFGDKRIGAAHVLIQGGKIDLGIQTAQKALGYMQSAATLSSSLDQDEQKLPLLESVSAHHQLLEELYQRDLENDQKDKLKSLIDQYQQLILQLGSDGN